MNRALPINSIRFIRGDTRGIYRLRINPEKKAPTIPSIPIIEVRAALRNMMPSTKIYCITASLYRRRK